MKKYLRFSHAYGHPRMTYTRCTGSIKTLIMLDSLENLHKTKYNFIVNQQFQAEEEDAQGEW
jgi:hypothetical protein